MAESAVDLLRVTKAASGFLDDAKRDGIILESFLKLSLDTVDCKYGIITGVSVYPAIEKESCWFYGIWGGRFKTGS